MEKLNNVSIVNKTVGKEVSFYYEAISNNKIKYIKVSLDFITDLDYNRIINLDKAIRASTSVYLKGITSTKYFNEVKQCSD